MLKSPDKKTQIAEAAEQLFHRFGYSKTSLEDIAQEAGLGKGTIYYYFESKEDIFFEIASHHAEIFYALLKKTIRNEKTFEGKFFAAISQPIKLVYEHAPILADAIRHLPEHYLAKLDSFREENKKRIIQILRDVIEQGKKDGIVTDTIPAELIVNIIFDWFLLGDSNIMIKYPDVFVKKAKSDYEHIVRMLLYGILKRGDN